MRPVIALLAIAMIGPWAVACADGGDEATPLPTLEAAATPTPGTGTVEVTLGEWSVLPDPESVTAGQVDFEVTNEGKVVHELVVIETDLDAGELPTVEDGSVDESKVDVLTEAEDIDAGGRADLAPDLEAGTYALVCNVVDEDDDGSVRSHYRLGMRTGFTVS